MPVHSKPFAGRAKKPPPLLSPKPYNKPTQNALASPTSPVSVSFVNGPTDDNHAQSVPNVHFSVLRRPVEKKPDKVPRSPQVVRFGATEVVGGVNDADEEIGRRKIDVIDETEECSSAAPKHTTKSSHLPASMSGAQALKECEVSKKSLSSVKMHEGCLGVLSGDFWFRDFDLVAMQLISVVINEHGVFQQSVKM